MIPLASNKAVAQIKIFEGFRAKAYEDRFKPGRWTIGYGTAIGVHPGDTMSEPQATARLVSDLAGLHLMLDKALTVCVGQNQADALYSLTYNVGIGKFLASRFHSKLNSKDPGAPQEMLNWDHDAQGHEVAGLKLRRQWEYSTFLLDSWPMQRI